MWAGHSRRCVLTRVLPAREPSASDDASSRLVVFVCVCLQSELVQLSLLSYCVRFPVASAGSQQCGLSKTVFANFLWSTEIRKLRPLSDLQLKSEQNLTKTERVFSEDSTSRFERQQLRTLCTESRSDEIWWILNTDLANEHTSKRLAACSAFARNWTSKLNRSSFGRARLRTVAASTAYLLPVCVRLFVNNCESLQFSKLNSVKWILVTKL